MSTQSFPLIGIDRNGNQHELEYPGLNARDAAKSAANIRGFVQVLSNDKGKRLANYRQPLFKSEASTTFSRPKSALALLLENQLLKTGPAIVDYLRSKGCDVSLVEKNGKVSVKVTPLAICRVKMDDLDALRNFVRPNTPLIVETLRAESEKTAAAEAPTETDILKGKKQREIVLAMLPQMPNPFTKTHFIERLKHAGYHDLAANAKKVQNALSYCTREGGETINAGHGQYEVLEQFRHRKPAELPSKPPAVVVSPPVIEQPPAQIPTPITPEAASVSEATSEAVVEPSSTVNPLIALLDLASQAASGTDDAADLAAKLTEACAVFETTILDAVSALTAVVKPVADRLNKQNRARQALVTSLTSVG